MIWLLLKNFLLNKIAIAGITILLLAGFAGIFIGSRHLQKAEISAKQTIQYQQAHTERNIGFYNTEIGLLLYYLRFAYINSSVPLNGISIGQRDVNSSIQFLTIRNLESQRYDTDLNNPFNLLSGSLDLSFVFIYLFPLFIISITYNLLSEEREGGTLKLLASQGSRLRNFLSKKLLVRALVLFSMFFVLMAAAKFAFSIPFDSSFLAASMLLSLYFLFWFTLCFWVVTWNKASGTNAASMLGIWVALNIMAPAAVNNFLAARYPVPEALATAVANREGFHEKWDMPKERTIQQFYAHYPQFQKFPLPSTQFNWLWYYAMQQAGDDAARASVQGLNQKLKTRDSVTRVLAAFIPTVHTQLHLSALGASDLDNQLKFMEDTEKFHEKLRLYFYPKIFSEEPVLSQDWKLVRAEYFQEDVQPQWLMSLLPLVLAIFFFAFLTGLNLRKSLIAG